MSHPFDSTMLAEMMSSMGISPQMLEKTLSNPNAMAKLASRLKDPTSPSSQSAEDIMAEIKIFKEKTAKENALPPMKVEPTPREEILRIFHRRHGEEAGGLRKTFMGMKQSYSRQPLNDLKQINIAQMWVCKRHEGSFLLCRVITQPSRTVAIGFGIEDTEGNTAQLFVYNFPTLSYATFADMDAIFSIGAVLAIREPTYKLSAFGSDPMLRVDSPSDIVFVDYDNSILHGQKWGSSATINRQTLAPHTSVETWRASGVTHFRAKRWLAAAVCFSNGVKLDPSGFILRLNRSEAYLRMAWYKSAFQDAEMVLHAVGSNIEDSYLRKAVFRAAKALYHLGEYNKAIEMANRRPQDEECQTWFTKASDRLHEQLSGEYDWDSIFQQSQASSEQVEMAEFTGPIQVRDVNGVGGGRGMFVTRDVKAGELLMVSKAIAIGNENQEQPTIFVNCITNGILPTRAAALRSQLIERLWEDSRMNLIIQALYAGSHCSPPTPYSPSPSLENSKPLEHPLQPSTDIDIMRVDGVCSFNCFGLRHLNSIDPAPQNESDPESYRASGMFSLPSLCNHSCLPSAHWTCFGDFMCVRAGRNLQKDEEITIQYFSGHQSFEKRQKASSNWGFACQCVLCEMDRKDGAKLRKDREDAMFQIQQDINGAYDAGVMRRALKLVDNIRRTYKDREKQQRCNVKPALFNAHHHLAVVYARRAQIEGVHFCKSSIEEGMKAIEAMGFIIIDKRLSGKIKSKSSLPIVVMQCPTLMSPESLTAVLQIVQNFYVLGELRRAELWLKAALYLEDICVGGGWQLFQMRHRVLLEEMGLTDFALRIVS
ncbi:hypothetical protein BD410DRAFT_638723 [Rickenella mellea]|uniref:SET domain-containing protein n=1 Tax=Rickenella mellea TaxID=50990 RepID=A0A4Y7QDI2_9AGAM|nr:hypothetical protein BD410DRAFT_638723 [Rickenella mellea]